jgi:outer membrane murein-binding lipoprotein Lpp
VNGLQSLIAPTAVAAIVSFLGIVVSSRASRKTSQLKLDVDDKHLKYDQLQEDLDAARADAKEAHIEASAARREAAEAWEAANSCVRSRESDRRQIAWRDMYIASLIHHINERLDPPPPAKPEGIRDAS